MRKTSRHVLILMPLAVTSLALVHGPALAQNAPDVYIVDVAFGGTGCPEGTTSAVLSEDAGALSILFDGFVAEGSDAEACTMAVVLSVPAGFTVALTGVEYRGYARTPGSGDARLAAPVLFAGQVLPVSRDFPPGFDSEYLLREIIELPIQAPCGSGAVVARADISLRTQGEGTTATVDGVTFDLDWHEC